jgi:hypothetical protein
LGITCIFQSRLDRQTLIIAVQASISVCRWSDDMTEHEESPVPQYRPVMFVAFGREVLRCCALPRRACLDRRRDGV